MFRILFLFILFMIGCGVKSPPLPPLSAEEQLKYDAEQKLKTERREQQIKAIVERNKKIEEEKKLKKDSNGN